MLVVAIDPMGTDISIEAEELDGRGHHIEVLSTERASREAQLRAVSAVLVTDAAVDEVLLDSMPNCRVVATYGVGYDNIDVQAAASRGVAVTNVPDYCTSEVADHTLALILALLRGVIPGHEMVRNGEWSLEPFASLRRTDGLRLGLIGVGRIGRAVADRARAFGFVLQATDPAPGNGAPGGIELVDLDTLLETSDIVSVHAPLTEGTRGLVSVDALARMRPGAILVNTTRGGLVDLPAALEALRAGRLGGLALDVFPQEPVDPRLFDGGGNMVLTPHIAFYSTAAMVEGRRSAARTIADVLDGQEVPNRVG